MSLRHRIGPGIVIAATGIGAGDLIAASVTGAKYGTVLLWAALLGAVMKYVVNEGLARWQLVTDTTLLEGWIQKLPRFFCTYFLVYLLLWSFVVAGALIAATGLAAHALLPQLSVSSWGILHSLAAIGLVLVGRYPMFESLMKFFIVLMFFVVLSCAILVAPDMGELAAGLFKPTIPEGSVLFILSVVGGVGGSVTVLSYGYWMREKGWRGKAYLRTSRIDLAVAYTMTGLFGIAVMIISAGVQPELLSGTKMVLNIADHLVPVAGPFGKWCFLIGFWAAVFSSMLGVWHGIPYLFTDFVQTWRAHRHGHEPGQINTRSRLYRTYLLYLGIPPMVLLLAGKPVWLVMVYAISGAFFMPLLAGLLLYMNKQSRWLGSERNGWGTSTLLFLSLAVFVILLAVKLVHYQ